MLLFGEVLSYMNSKASLSCSNFGSNKANCFEDMFNFLDVSGNKALSNAEINRASKLLIFFSTVNGQEFNDAGVFALMSSYAITPILTKFSKKLFKINRLRKTRTCLSQVLVLPLIETPLVIKIVTKFKSNHGATRI